MTWNKFILFSFVLLCGISNIRGAKLRVFDGKGVKIEDFPYQVSLRSVGNAHYCGGSIISDRHVLTAAHCIVTLLALSLSVHTGTGYRSVNGTVRTVEQLEAVNVHPEWNRTLQASYKNDIAIITLKEPIVFDSYQQKINLPKENVRPGSKAILTGWGLTSKNPDVNAEQLQMLETTIVPNDDCQEKVDRTIYDTQVCAFRGEGSGACSGDSGGPLVVDGEIAGIVSWVKDGRCGFGLPEVYTNVYAYKDFIESVVNKRVDTSDSTEKSYETS